MFIFLCINLISIEFILYKFEMKQSYFTFQESFQKLTAYAYIITLSQS